MNKGKILRFFMSFVYALMILGCGVTPTLATENTSADASQIVLPGDMQPAFSVIEPPLPGQKRYHMHILCVTNRKEKEIKSKFTGLGEMVPQKQMKFENDASADGLTYTDCDITFSGKPDMRLLQTPMDCKLSPYSWVKWQLKSPAIDSIRKITETEFFAYLRKASQDGQIYVILPGSFTRFDEAVKRSSAAVLALNSKAVFVFSWPAQGSIRPDNYGYDGTQAERSILVFERLMSRLAKEFGSKNVHVIAHSMGNRIITWTSAVIMLRNGCLDDEGVCRIPDKFGRLEMVSADIDASLFVDNYAGTVKATYTAADIWVSKKDKALMLSKLVHKKPRLGQRVKELPVIPGIRFIVFTKADMGLFGHSVPFPILAKVIKSQGQCPGFPWKFVRIRDGESPIDELVKRKKGE